MDRRDPRRDHRGLEEARGSRDERRRAHRGADGHRVRRRSGFTRRRARGRERRDRFAAGDLRASRRRGCARARVRAERRLRRRRGQRADRSRDRHRRRDPGSVPRHRRRPRGARRSGSEEERSGLRRSESAPFLGHGRGVVAPRAEHVLASPRDPPRSAHSSAQGELLVDRVEDHRRRARGKDTARRATRRVRHRASRVRRRRRRQERRRARLDALRPARGEGRCLAGTAHRRGEGLHGRPRGRRTRPPPDHG